MSPSAPLTEQEVETLAALARGMSYEEAAGKLGVSRAAVASRMRTAMAVLGARTQAHAVARAVEAGYRIVATPRRARHPVPDRRTRRLRPRGREPGVSAVP